MPDYHHGVRVIEISNGTTTTDIDFLSNGLIDVAAIEAQAGAGEFCQWAAMCTEFQQCGRI